MTDAPKSLLPMQMAFRQAGKSVCNRYAELKDMRPVQQNSVVGQQVRQKVGQKNETGKSSAQVASAVGQQSVRRQTCGLKPEPRPLRISTRFTSDERDFLVGQAESSCLTLSEYIRASALGSGYAATIDPMKRQLLQDAIRELNRQGNNLNQIARHLNAGDMEPDQGKRELSRLEQSLIAAQRAVRAALTEGKSY
jgi:hypothetical protein